MSECPLSSATTAMIDRRVRNPVQRRRQGLARANRPRHLAQRQPTPNRLVSATGQGPVLEIRRPLRSKPPTLRRRRGVGCGSRCALTDYDRSTLRPVSAANSPSSAPNSNRGGGLALLALRFDPRAQPTPASPPAPSRRPAAAPAPAWPASGARPRRCRAGRAIRISRPRPRCRPGAPPHADPPRP